ncbi:unnamed protein product [Cuscuta europaea]|nr:unnamed protein product [Cuscuta europaea]
MALHLKIEPKDFDPAAYGLPPAARHPRSSSPRCREARPGGL